MRWQLRRADVLRSMVPAVHNVRELEPDVQKRGDSDDVPGSCILLHLMHLMRDSGCCPMLLHQPLLLLPRYQSLLLLLRRRIGRDHRILPLPRLLMLMLRLVHQLLLCDLLSSRRLVLTVE